MLAYKHRDIHFPFQIELSEKFIQTTWHFAAGFGSAFPPAKGSSSSGSLLVNYLTFSCAKSSWGMLRCVFLIKLQSFPLATLYYVSQTFFFLSSIFLLFHFCFILFFNSWNSLSRNISRVVLLLVVLLVFCGCYPCNMVTQTIFIREILLLASQNSRRQF